MSNWRSTVAFNFVRYLIGGHERQYNPDLKNSALSCGHNVLCSVGLKCGGGSMAGVDIFGAPGLNYLLLL